MWTSPPQFLLHTAAIAKATPDRSQGRSQDRSQDPVRADTMLNLDHLLDRSLAAHLNNLARIRPPALPAPLQVAKHVANVAAKTTNTSTENLDEALSPETTVRALPNLHIPSTVRAPIPQFLTMRSASLFWKICIINRIPRWLKLHCISPFFIINSSAGVFLGGANNLLLNGKQFAVCNQTIVDALGYGETCGVGCGFANIQIEPGKTYLFRIVVL